MRISCEYKTDKFPLAYHMFGVSLIKEALMKVDKEYYNNLYKYNNIKSNKSTKDFCFSVYMQGYEKKEDIFLIKDKVIFNFSSPNYEFMVNLYNGLLEIEAFRYKEFNLNKVKINLVKEKSINNEVVTFRTLSPIHIKDKNNIALDINDDNFVKELNYIANKTLENYRGFGLKKELKFIPSINMKKRVVKQDIRTFKDKTNKPYYYVNSYVGEFQLEGNINDLKEIYLLGLGFKLGQGFGMIEVVR
ncbi:MAG: CRISPR-associated endoribonuclease Cas6 [Vallitalea sp.]|jgi:CRISPR-associated endoribonuclease Cas6|nr:CRISPR-associated endoribonuclease Cas6 [Vallitalea sp.]